MVPKAEVEDVVQETFIRLWTTRSRYQPDRSSLKTWLYRIAHNLCIDCLRKKKPQAPEDEIALSSGPDTHEPDHALHDSQQVQRLNEALDAMAERQRSAIILTHYQGLGHRDAAEILDVSVDALESMLRRARQKLKQQLETTP